MYKLRLYIKNENSIFTFRLLQKSVMKTSFEKNKQIYTFAKYNKGHI